MVSRERVQAVIERIRPLIQGDGGDIAFVELLGSEATLDEKRQKRNAARTKRAEENRKAMEEATAQAAPAEGGEGTEEK